MADACRPGGGGGGGGGGGSDAGPSGRAGRACGGDQQQQQQPAPMSLLDRDSQWLQLRADDYSAWVSLQTLCRHRDSLLAGLADTAASQGQDQLRLDVDPSVARELVSVLRLGDGYEPPDDARLVAALQHQLDFFGVAPPPSLPRRAPARAPYLFVHAYSCQQVDDGDGDRGMFLYTATGGFGILGGGAMVSKDGSDPRPPGREQQWVYSAATLPAEATGAAQDLMLVAGPLACDTSSYMMEADTLRRRAVSFPPNGGGPCVAVGARVYVLGTHADGEVMCYDAAVDAWFTPAAMPGGRYDFAAAAPPGSSAVLAFGGVDSATGRHRSSVELYDVRARRWSAAPGGAELPRASRGLAAAALDAQRVLVWGGSAGPEAHVLDLRTWRWLPAGAISGQRQHMGGVAFDGMVLSLGGVDEHYDYVDAVDCYDPRSNSWAPLGRLPCALSQPAAVAANVSTSLWCSGGGGGAAPAAAAAAGGCLE